MFVCQIAALQPIFSLGVMQLVVLISPKKYQINQIIIKKFIVKNLEKYICNNFNVFPSESFHGKTIGIKGKFKLDFSKNITQCFCFGIHSSINNWMS